MTTFKRFFFLVCVVWFCIPHLALAQQKEGLTQYVDPFIGTGAVENSLSGSTFPGATLPFGFVQLSPDTRHKINLPTSGYDYNDNTIVGFSHTHLSGTGVSDLFDVLLMPTVGKTLTVVGDAKIARSGYRSKFSHERESAKPGYYQVQLADYNINAELTSTLHCGLHQYTFPPTDSAHVIIDLSHSIANRAIYPYANLASEIKVINSKTIEGYRMVTGWAKLRKVYFRIEFSEPMISYTLKDRKATPRNNILVPGENGYVAAIDFSTKTKNKLLVKVGLSPVSIENARQNLIAELPDWGFDKVVASADEAWEKELNKIKIDGTVDQKKIFYTGLYHAFVQPNLMSDSNGDYQSPDFSLKNTNGTKQYSTFSLWDTHRAVHPLYTLVQQERTADFINSMIGQYNEMGFLPIWQLWGDENYCMIANHAIPVLVDAGLKGIKNIDINKAYEAVKGSVNRDHLFSSFSLLEKYNYMPYDLQWQSVSMTLEMAYDDWCVAQLAKSLGKEDDYQYFIKRSGYYKNVFDQQSGFFRAKAADGQWINPFDPLHYSGNGKEAYTEANAWQYLWSVQHDVDGLVQLLGGEKKFAEKLDQFFSIPNTSVKVNFNASGFIGQYAHGNEPSHHVAYLYNYAGQPWKAQFYIAKILRTLYNTSSSGYAGNEDCGQMSAWYIFSAMGFYPVNPANGVYVLGSPLLKEANIEISKTKTFKVRAKNASAENIYIQSVKLNGKTYDKSYITQSVITDGGLLEFDMGAKPNTKWATSQQSTPIAWGY